MVLLAAVKLHRADRIQRLRAAELAFRYARRTGVDEIRMQPIFIEEPPDEISRAINTVVAMTGRKGRFAVLANPSDEVLETLLSAAPYIESVNLMRAGRVVAGLSDAADNLSVQMSGADWQSFRLELEEFLDTPLEFDVAELRT